MDKFLLFNNDLFPFVFYLASLHLRFKGVVVLWQLFSLQNMGKIFALNYRFYIWIPHHTHTHAHFWNKRKLILFLIILILKNLGKKSVSLTNKNFNSSIRADWQTDRQNKNLLQTVIISYLFSMMLLIDFGL